MRVERLPLNALRAFNEAAREQSFKRAADKLGVTPGAVSRQVKQLEQRLGVVLFERHASGIKVNQAGQRLAQEVQAGLSRIAGGVEQITQPADGAFELLISAPPSLLQLWLLPRLPAFEARQQQVNVSLDADARQTEPMWLPNRARLALRYGQAPWSGVESTHLFKDVLFPVCSPGLLAQHRIETPEDLLSQTLLTVEWQTFADSPIPGWHDWFQQAGVTQPPISRQRHYSLYSLALDQAIAGQGVVLASYPLIKDRLKSGVLVRPFQARYPLTSRLSYSLIRPASGEPPPAVAQFCEWLLAQAALLETPTP
ncbi:LysR substrate-binding domain-containing protein [Vreelandella sp. EE27]